MIKEPRYKKMARVKKKYSYGMNEWNDTMLAILSFVEDPYAEGQIDLNELCLALCVRAADTHREHERLRYKIKALEEQVKFITENLYEV